MDFSLSAAWCEVDRRRFRARPAQGSTSHDWARRARIARHNRERVETVWAWLSLVALVLCWDACLRLDHRVSIPRPRIAHAVERELIAKDPFTEM